MMELQLFSYQHNIILNEDAKLEISSLHINKKIIRFKWRWVIFIL
jgi:hypothetical protein